MPSTFSGTVLNLEFERLLVELLSELHAENLFLDKTARLTLLGRALRFRYALEDAVIDAPNLDDWEYRVPIIAAIYGTQIPLEPSEMGLSDRQYCQASYRERTMEMALLIDYLGNIPADEPDNHRFYRHNLLDTLTNVRQMVRREQNQLWQDDEEEEPYEDTESSPPNITMTTGPYTPLD